MPISINKKLGLAINPNKENLDNWDRLIKISHKNPNNLSARSNKLYAKLGKINKKQTPIKINGKIIKLTNGTAIRFEIIEIKVYCPKKYRVIGSKPSISFNCICASLDV